MNLTMDHLSKSLQFCYTVSVGVDRTNVQYSGAQVWAVTVADPAQRATLEKLEKDGFPKSLHCSHILSTPPHPSNGIQNGYSWAEPFRVAGPPQVPLSLMMFAAPERNVTMNNRKFDQKIPLTVWQNQHGFMDILVQKPLIYAVNRALRANHIAYGVAIDDVRNLLDKEKPKNHGTGQSEANRLNDTQINWTSYHRLSVIYNFMDQLVAKYPRLCTVLVIGKTPEGRDMKLIKISNGDSSNKPVWVDGTIHAREWISPSVVTYIINQIATNFADQPASITNKDWYILPVMNPDGYEYSHTTDRMWRKNRRRYGEYIGVDLNRNFSVGWGERGEEASSNDPGSIFYRGPEPFSEPETAAVKNFIMKASRPFIAFVSYHSYGEAIIYPWGHSDVPCPDYLRLLQVGAHMAKSIYDATGQIYRVGSTKDLMYYAAGVSTDWSYHAARILYSYMVEMRNKEHRFVLPVEQILPTALENLAGLKTLMENIDKQTLCNACFDHLLS